MSRKLTGKQVRYLRGLGHKLRPAVMVGKDEITDTLVQSAHEALAIHELIKVKLQEGCIMDRKDVAKELSKNTESEVAQILGKTILLYRKGEKPAIKLP